MKKIITGKIKVSDYREAYDILFVGDEDEPLAELFQDYIEHFGKFVTIRYFTSESEKNIDELNENLIRKISGASEADYGEAYSEYTGYLWTDEELNIGGHDLLTELKSHDGRFLWLEAEFHKQRNLSTTKHNTSKE